MKVSIPKTGIEIIDCDKCSQFYVVGPNSEREESPDFLVYLSITAQEPLFCFVEFKNQPETHAIAQFKKGIDVLRERHRYFSVTPEPQKVDCVLARDRGKGMAHAAQLAVILDAKFLYKGKPARIRFVEWGTKLFPFIDNSYY